MWCLRLADSVSQSYIHILNSYEYKTNGIHREQNARESEIENCTICTYTKYVQPCNLQTHRITHKCRLHEIVAKKCAGENKIFEWNTWWPPPPLYTICIMDYACSRHSHNIVGWLTDWVYGRSCRRNFGGLHVRTNERVRIHWIHERAVCLANSFIWNLALERMWCTLVSAPFTTMSIASLVGTTSCETTQWRSYTRANSQNPQNWIHTHTHTYIFVSKIMGQYTLHMHIYIELMEFSSLTYGNNFHIISGKAKTKPKQTRATLKRPHTHEERRKRRKRRKWEEMTMKRSVHK